MTSGDESGERYQRALFELAALGLWDYEEALRRILRLEAETLGVERVNYWSLSKHPLAIHCEEAFEKTSGRYERGQLLSGEEFPHYFEALKLEQLIDAEDAHHDARTAEFTESYLRPLGIGAMLDVPVWSRGSLTGVLCHEHVGPSRVWSAKEKQFAIAMAQAVATVIAVRERRRAEADLHAAEEEKIRLTALEQVAREEVRARDDFLSVASHELYTPITSLQLAIDALRVSQPAGSAALKSLALVDRQLKRLTQLVSSLLDVSRISSGRLELTPEELDLVELVRDVCERFAETSRRAGCSLGVRATDAVVGRWDRSHLDQVLTNLLSNACKFAPGHPVDVSVEGEDGRARLIVSDQGIGVDPERLPRVFERFERAVSSRSYGGLGLGLYIVRAIVEAHGGQVNIVSEPGRGTTVTVELPR